MPPIAIQDTRLPDVSIADLKAKLVNRRVEFDETPGAPVADDFMYDFQYNHHLPTTDVLGTTISPDLDAVSIAQDIAGQLAKCLASRDAVAFSELFLEYGVWRDRLAFTWDYRTFNFRCNIRKAAEDLLPRVLAKNVKLLSPIPSFQRPYPDYQYLQFVIGFDTEHISASAVIAAVLTTNGWRIYYMTTAAEGLLAFPEVNPRDGHMTGNTSWERQRQAEDDGMEPDVLIIGGGQNGLALGARLKALGVATLIIERNASVGDIWKNRYEYLSLHFPHWADHFPYFPYPEHWPTYTPAQKQGIFMEWYASAMELPVWTNSNVVSAVQHDGKAWTVKVAKHNSGIRVLRPKQVVMATSLCGMPMMPLVPGASQFGGIIRHSSAHDSSRDFVGKRVCVVGTSSSGFDTAYDCARRGIDVTLLQRSPTYIMSLTHSVPRAIGAYAPVNGTRPDPAEVDRLFFGTPLGPSEELGRRNAKVLEDLDRDLLDGLHRHGLRTWRGQRGTGQQTLGATRNGGFYFDAGACEHIINGNIKVEQGYVEAFTKDKVVLSGGRERDFDLVVFATGFSNTVDSIRATLGEDIAKQCGPIWGIDKEGEIKTAYRETGVHNLWLMVGYLPMTRYHSKLVALRLKALLAGIPSEPYKR